MSGAFPRKNFLRDIPFPFCAGCGGVTVATCFLRAVYELGHPTLREFVFCSGIGCSSWIPSPHFKADSIHTTHGRSIPVATGIKLMRPDLNVVVFGGDGDIGGIGLSHLIHAARRNVNLTVIMVNNMIYGMTGGQVAATTPVHVKTTTTPYGGFERPLDAVQLVVSAGASYAARWTTGHVVPLKEAIKKALTVDGFSFVEVLSQCPTAYGRLAGFQNAGAILQWLKSHSITIAEAKTLTDQGLEDKIIVGEFVSRRIPTLTKRLQAVLKEADNDD
jgi:2-oxoglutarate ferredoxin oxidoreductase subunit beta